MTLFNSLPSEFVGEVAAARMMNEKPVEQLKALFLQAEVETKVLGFVSGGGEKAMVARNKYAKFTCRNCGEKGYLARHYSKPKRAAEESN